MKEFIIEKKDSGQRVDKYLLRLMPNTTKSFLYKMMRKKNIVLNDKKIEGNEILKLNDSVKLWFSNDTFDKFSKTDVSDINVNEYEYAYKSLKNINILYEDEHFIIVYKPAGILSQKAQNNDISINEWIIGYCLNNKSIDKTDLVSCKPSIVNRLDRNTSGIILAGKTIYGLNKLTTLIRNRDIKKYYLTYVYGKLEGEKHLKAYHLKDELSNKVNIISEEKYSLLSDNDKGLYTAIETFYKSIEHYYINVDNKKFNITKLEIDLITGKSHQIRAHMAHIGHFLLGDDKYGNRDINSEFKLKYQLLHAYKVVFPNDNDLFDLNGKEIICQPSNLEDFEDRFLKN